MCVGGLAVRLQTTNGVTKQYYDGGVNQHFSCIYDWVDKRAVVNHHVENYYMQVDHMQDDPLERSD